MSKGSKARAVADVSSGMVFASVDIDAPPERVFRALASEEITRWWGSDDLYRTTAWTGELKVGGRWRSSGVGAHGSAFSVEGEFLEIDPPRKLVHTWKPDWESGAPTTVTYRLEAIPEGTRITVRHEGFTSAESCTGHADGWTRVLGWLQGFAAPRAEGSFFFVRLLPPRPTFMHDMTDSERRMMGEHVVYWRGLMKDGIAAAFGPVADPQGGWGLGILEVASADAIAPLQANDPAIKSGLGFRYEVMPMLRAIVRG
jgi:uncharacterized protein YndB with AHSA1/START domain